MPPPPSGGSGTGPPPPPSDRAGAASAPLALPAAYEAVREAVRSKQLGRLGACAQQPHAALSDGEFQRVFERNRDEFEGLPAWQQRGLLRKAWLHVAT